MLEMNCWYYGWFLWVIGYGLWCGNFVVAPSPPFVLSIYTKIKLRNQLIKQWTISSTYDICLYVLCKVNIVILIIFNDPTNSLKLPWLVKWCWDNSVFAVKENQHLKQSQCMAPVKAQKQFYQMNTIDHIMIIISTHNSTLPPYANHTKTYTGWGRESKYGKIWKRNEGRGKSGFRLRKN